MAASCRQHAPHGTPWRGIRTSWISKPRSVQWPMARSTPCSRASTGLPTTCATARTRSCAQRRSISGSCCRWKACAEYGAAATGSRRSQKRFCGRGGEGVSSSTASATQRDSEGACLAELWPERLLNGLVIRSQSAAALARVLQHLLHICK
eukprot:scaffold64380_cov60-Phaeocystis_antarctica.AAC.3